MALMPRKSTASAPSPVFFVDADLSDRIFCQILTDAGIRFERHDDHFDPGTSDEEWLSVAGKNDWIALSHNKKIRRNSAQVDRLMEAGLRAFMLIGDAVPNPPGQRSVFTRTLAENFVRTLPSIHRFLARHEGPWIAKLYRPERWGEGVEPAPGEIRMWLTMQKWLREK
jgi:hypothetical protein